MELLVWFVCVAGAFPTRFFVGHSIYKGKAALTVEPRAPEFTPLDVCFVKFPVRNMVFDLLVIVVIGLFFMVLGLCLGCLVCDGLCCVQSGAFKISKDGFVLLQFAPAAGVRQYDWSRKQVIYTWLFHIIKCGTYGICFVIF